MIGIHTLTNLKCFDPEHSPFSFVSELLPNTSSHYNFTTRSFQDILQSHIQYCCRFDVMTTYSLYPRSAVRCGASRSRCCDRDGFQDLTAQPKAENATHVGKTGLRKSFAGILHGLRTKSSFTTMKQRKFLKCKQTVYVGNRYRTK